jgi:hypothetical protein
VRADHLDRRSHGGRLSTIRLIFRRAAARCLAALAPEERAAQLARAADELVSAGTDLVIDSVAALPGAVAKVEHWQAQGRLPRGAPRLILRSPRSSTAARP